MPWSLRLNTLRSSSFEFCRPFQFHRCHSPGNQTISCGMHCANHVALTSLERRASIAVRMENTLLPFASFLDFYMLSVCASVRMFAFFPCCNVLAFCVSTCFLAPSSVFVCWCNLALFCLCFVFLLWSCALRDSIRYGLHESLEDASHA